MLICPRWRASSSALLIEHERRASWRLLMLVSRIFASVKDGPGDVDIRKVSRGVPVLMVLKILSAISNETAHQTVDDLNF
jgi:hypothetical protein